MSAAFPSAILKDSPTGVLIVHDRFHITKMMNEVLDEVRRSEQNRLESQGKQVLTGGRYLLLHNRDSVEQDPANSSRLDQLLAANGTLHQVYLLKVELRLLWEQPTQLHAHWLLQQWLRTAREIGLRPLDRFCDTIDPA